MSAISAVLVCYYTANINAFFETAKFFAKIMRNNLIFGNFVGQMQTEDDQIVPSFP
jgi:hypothetical protein